MDIKDFKKLNERYESLVERQANLEWILNNGDFRYDNLLPVTGRAIREGINFMISKHLIEYELSNIKEQIKLTEEEICRLKQ